MQAARPCIEPCAAKPYATGLFAPRPDLQYVLQSAPGAAIEASKAAMRRKALRHGPLRDAPCSRLRVRFQGLSSTPEPRPKGIGVKPTQNEAPHPGAE
jgi:hypothetical protein